jgi:hypothetical protein
MNFVYAESINDVLKAALEKPARTSKKISQGKKNEKSIAGG